MQALIAASYQVYAINPLQVARYRERHGVSGAKSDPGDAHTLADMVRTDRHQLRPVAGDSDLAEAIKVLTRAHKTLIWEKTRHTLRLRRSLLEFFPAALAAYDDLAAPDTLTLLDAAPDPASAAALTGEQIAAALRAARRRNIENRTARIQTGLRRAVGPARRGGWRVRGHRACPSGDPDRPQHPDRGHTKAGGDAFWPAPGR